MIRRTLPILLLILLTGCNQHVDAPKGPGEHREVIQGLHTQFIRVTEGNNQWFEMAISVDESNTFRMPVFFVEEGKLVRVDDKQARQLFDRWLKERAKGIAAFSSVDEQVGTKGPFLALDIKR
uniref:hypothetical protein n=1 Tax=Pseudomonas syringae TaxID=317 RepID=UPI001E3F3BC1|nr:hypothetical protein [Pseudomonas syringae]QOU99737.1 Outer membrane lipoprotein-sorting protein [Pseudomonas syringae pv. actinidiae]